MLYKTMNAALLSIAMLQPVVLQAQSPHHMHHQAHSPVTENSLRLEVKPEAPLTKGKNSLVQIELIDIKNQQKLSLSDLKEVHTEKVHLLIIDSTLSDYHHIHPRPDLKTGAFVFNFTPQKNGTYRIWADITPLQSNQQEYVMAEIDMKSTGKPFIDKTVNTTFTLNDYTFTLKLDGEPQAGKAIMGTITIDKNNKPFTGLEPVMGAFAHIVGFGEDFNSVLHIHPMGKEPEKSTDRGGPTLKFHMEPKTAGFIKLFAQMRIAEQDIFVPFGIIVK